MLERIAEIRPDLLARVRVITGASVGAVNGVYLASHGLTPNSVKRLASLWRSLRIDALLSVARMSALRMVGVMPLRLFRRGVRSPATGLLTATPLWRLVARETDWKGLDRLLAQGRFGVVAIAGTDIRSGKTHLFAQGSVVSSLPGVTETNDFTLMPTRLGLRHVLASAAIPLLFPPIRIGGRWYMDGGVRYNTPLSPALRLGAESLIILGVRGVHEETVTGRAFPGIGQVLGKLLDSVFLDRVAFDLDRLERINHVVEAAEKLGVDEAKRFHDGLEALGRPAYRCVRYASVRPSQDIGVMAARTMRESKSIPSASFVRLLGAVFEDDERASGDAASFLLFDGRFAGDLIELGRRDADGAADQLARI